MAINLTRIKAVHPWPCGARLIGDERTALLIELHQWSYHHLRHLKVNGFEYDTFIPETCGLCGLENHVWRFVKGHEDTWYDFAELEEFAALGCCTNEDKDKLDERELFLFMTEGVFESEHSEATEDDEDDNYFFNFMPPAKRRCIV